MNPSSFFFSRKGKIEASTSFLDRFPWVDAEVRRSSDEELPALVLRDLEQKLRDEGFVIVQRVLGARVPILKMRTQVIGRKMDCDLSVNNLLPCFNTKLLRVYAELNPHVVRLVQECKQWAKEHKVHGAQWGHLSSYAFTLMVIFFLQLRKELPVLQKGSEQRPVWFSEGRRRYNVAMEEVMDSYVEQDSASFTDFIRFYRVEFQWGKQVVSVRRGELLDLASFPEMKKNLRRGVSNVEYAWMIHIEDPFDLVRNLNSVLGPGKNELLWQAFEDTPAGVRRWRRGGYARP